MKRIIVLLFMSTLLASCLNVDEVDPIADMVERAKADNEELIAYMKSHKLVIDQENASPNNINWEIQELAESDNPETESLFYLIGGSPYIHVWEGLEFKLY